ncbi:MAG: two-component regulator propeller domain-containing protein [Acidobacteriota bacterium]
MRAVGWLIRAFVRVVLLPCLLLSAQVIGQAEQLPARTYTTADGLPRDLVLRIVRDSHGFLWFCTGDGLSRFNGYDFTTYGVEHGLTNPRVNDLLETRNGVYWVATQGGVFRFNPSAFQNQTSEGGTKPALNQLFTLYPMGNEPMSNRVDVLFEDHNGQIWAGTDQGAFRLDESNGKATFLPVTLGDQMVVAIAEDREAGLWMSTTTGLRRRLPDGRTTQYTIQTSGLGDLLTTLLFDREGRLWIGTRGGAGLVVLKPQPSSSITTDGERVTLKLDRCNEGANSADHRIRLPNAPGEACQFTTTDGLAGMIVEGMSQSSDGRIWIGTEGGLTEFGDGRFRSYTTELGLSNPGVATPVEDRDGNLWLGSEAGATKITWSGFTTFGKADGLGTPRITSITENQNGEICSVSSDTEYFINCFDGRRFKAIRPQFPREIKGFGWGTNQVAFQDHLGEWWLPTSSGLCRFPRVARAEDLAHTRPKAVYSYEHGELPGNDTFRLFEDSRGDVWISISGNLPNAIVRWDRATESFHVPGAAEGVPPFALPTAYREDAAGNLWMGFYNGGLVRYRAGRFQSFTKADGAPAGLVSSIYLDAAGRLWIATDSGGVARVNDPQSDRPRFVVYTITDGLSSNSVFCITEDKLGRIYLGTARGLDRFDRETAHIRHYTKAEGLASNAVTTSFRDRQGALWFGTDVGLSRLFPGPDPPQQQPPILISGLRIAGNVQSISALGETEISGLALNPTQNQLSIDFVGLGFAAGGVLKYQYKLVGATEDWSPLTDQRTITYASLSPGNYRFMVRAVTADGISSATPATVAFTIMQPIWQRWWFIAAVTILTALLVYSLYLRRVAHLVELEKVRTRIATDLHDDIGASLSLIAMLSEVARRQALVGNFKVGDSLSSIAASSRELVDAMSDIVWAVNPRKDRFSELVTRMRRFASEVFSSREIALQFEAADQDHDFKLGADARREIFFIVKEGVNNIARHSSCTEAAVILKKQGGWLILELRDNGKGFDPAQADQGNGLASMRERAARLGGELELNAASGRGTTLRLKVPVERQRWRLG